MPTSISLSAQGDGEVGKAAGFLGESMLAGAGCFVELEREHVGRGPGPVAL